MELIGGLALVLGIVPRIAALALMGFLVPATLTAHAFWAADGPQAFMGQLVNFLKNIAMMGGLLFIASTGGQPTVMSKIRGSIDAASTLPVGRKRQI
jgi:putative oxidoreductase